MASEAKPADAAVDWDGEVIGVNIDYPDLDLIALGFASRAEFDAFIQEGLDDIAAGRVVSHEIVKADIAAMRAELGRR